MTLSKESLWSNPPNKFLTVNFRKKIYEVNFLKLICEVRGRGRGRTAPMRVLACARVASTIRTYTLAWFRLIGARARRRT